MNKKEKMKHCSGCYDNHYNIFSGDCCWGLETMKLIWRKEVPIYQFPPWTQKASKLPNCYRKPGYSYVGKDQIN
jgi:hypothetical protein